MSDPVYDELDPNGSCELPDEAPAEYVGPPLPEDEHHGALHTAHEIATVAHPLLGAGEVGLHTVGVHLPPAAGPALMGVGMLSAGAEFASGDVNGGLCGLQESIPLLGLYSMMTGCRFPDPTDNTVRPEEAMIQQCFDPDTAELVTAEESDRRQQLAEDARNEVCVQR